LAKDNKTLKMPRFFFTFFFSVFLFLIGLSATQAADLYLAPNSGNFEVGQTFNISVYVNSADQAMNAADLKLRYPIDKLAVQSISKNGSIFSLWVVEPIFSNSEGTAQMEGVIFTPGYTGKNGKIATVNFRTKSAGNAEILISKGSVLANDGQATNILKSLGKANININLLPVGEQPGQTTSPIDKAGLPLAPLVLSNSHPNSDIWYAQTKADFSWNTTANVKEVSVAVDDKVNTNPGTVADGNFSNFSTEVKSDGEWYFHVRLKNDKGWGSIAHYRFRVDTTKPDQFSIEEVTPTDLTEPVREFKFIAADKMSGINHFEIQIDGSDLPIWQPQENKNYHTPPLLGGDHVMIVRAVDKAGNYITNSVQFKIMPLPAPQVLEYSETLVGGNYLVVKASSYSNSQVSLWVQPEGQEPAAITNTSDSSGNVTLVYNEKVKDGLYYFWLTVTDDRGAISEAGKKYTVIVSPSKLQKFGTSVINILVIIIPLLALILLLLFVLWYAKHWYNKLKIKLDKEIKEVEDSVHLGLERIRTQFNLYIKFLESIKIKKQLTKEQIIIINELKKNINELARDVEKHIDKEIKDVENISFEVKNKNK
jgi:hypothetical protein